MHIENWYEGFCNDLVTVSFILKALCQFQYVKMLFRVSFRGLRV